MMPTPHFMLQNHLRALVFGSAFLAGWPDFAQGQAYDPSGYLKQREFEQQPETDQKLQHATVTMGGITYHKFQNGDGAIYVPKLTDLTEADFEKALCANSAPTDNPKPVHRQDSVVATKAAAQVTEKVELFAQLIVVTIHKKCGEPATATDTGVKVSDGTGLEVGAKVNTGTERRPSSTTIFNTNLLPNIGVRNDF